MTRHTNSRIIGQNALDALAHFPRAIGDRHLSRVQRVADAYSAAVVNGDPACAAGGIEQGIQQRPIRDSVRAVLHFLGFAEWRGD